MKKILSILVLASFLALMVMPIALAAEPVPGAVTKCKMRHDLTGTDWTGKGFYCPAKASDCPFDVTVTGCTVGTVDCTCGSCCLMDTIYTITDWIFVGVIVIVVAMILLGAFEIITAGAVAEKVTKGRTYIIYALIGLFVALLAKAIPAIAKSILGM